MIQILLIVIVVCGILALFKDGRKFLYYILSSLDNFSRGASSNKLSAVAAIGVSIYITKRYTTVDNQIWILIIWLMFALLCLGLVAFKQITELVQSYKNGNSGNIHFEEKPTLNEILNTPPKDGDIK